MGTPAAVNSEQGQLFGPDELASSLLERLHLRPRRRPRVIVFVGGPFDGAMLVGVAPTPDLLWHVAGGAYLMRPDEHRALFVSAGALP
jgi:hypothetical protein